MKRVLLIFGLLFAASSAHAQQIQQCAPYKAQTDYLKEKFNEHRMWTGVLTVPGAAFEVEIWQSEQGSWTMLALRGDMACLMHTGINGEAPIVGDEV